ncbi:hypothetical protein E2320_003319 [Naja naja]|nr:hypothetical protein E2320_003319 [Naja naja]
MGKGQNKGTKVSEEIGVGRKQVTRQSIPTDSPLGQLLQQWLEPWVKTYTQNLEKKKMIYLCCQQWPQYPLIDPEFPYYWDPEGETSKYCMNQLKDYIIKHKMKEQLPYLEVWYHVRFEGPVPPAREVKQFVTKEDESETEEWMGRPPASAPAAIQLPPPPIPLAPIPPSPSPPPPPAHPGLRRELAQLNKDLENLPLGGTRTNLASAFPVREVANGTNAQGNPVTVFVAVPIKPTELRELKGLFQSFMKMRMR